MGFNKILRIAEYPARADQSAVAAIHRALRGCCTRSRDPGYFVKEHNRPLLVRQASFDG